MKIRLADIDVLKGIAITCVVLGHVIQYLTDVTMWPYAKNIWNFIYSFHMPLFMFLSGAVQHSTFLNGSDFIERTKKRFLRLMVPFFSWAIIAWCFQGTSILSVIINPECGLWFLEVLFLINVLYDITVFFSKWINWLFAFFLVYGALLLFIQYVTGACGLWNTAYYFPLFLGGYFIHAMACFCSIIESIRLFYLWYVTCCCIGIGHGALLTIL